MTHIMYTQWHFHVRKGGQELTEKFKKFDATETDAVENQKAK